MTEEIVQHLTIKEITLSILVSKERGEPNLIFIQFGDIRPGIALDLATTIELIERLEKVIEAASLSSESLAKLMRNAQKAPIN